MNLDPQIAGLFVLTTGVGFLMIAAGLQKSMLELRSRRRTCPSCGRAIKRRVCSACAAAH